MLFCHFLRFTATAVSGENWHNRNFIVLRIFFRNFEFKKINFDQTAKP